MEPQSTLSGFSVQTNRASCVFVRQKVFCQTKINLPSLMVGEFSSKVGKYQFRVSIAVKVNPDSGRKSIVTSPPAPDERLPLATRALPDRWVFRDKNNPWHSLSNTTSNESIYAYVWKQNPDIRTNLQLNPVSIYTTFWTVSFKPCSWPNAYLHFANL